MNIRILPSLCFSLALALAACNPEAPAWNPADTSPKPLKVDYVRLTHPAAFAANSPKLSDSEIERLTAFLDNAQVTADDHVYLQPAPGDKLSAQRVGQLTRQLSGRGIGARTLPAAKDVASDHLVVLVERYVVTPPNCPDWTKDPVANHDNTPPSNFGCATVTNLGLMVADPRDLVIGRQMGPEEGDPALAGIQRFRAGKTKAIAGSGGFAAGAGPTGGGGSGPAVGQ
jgi:pilus assembly protein CpaD